MLGTKQSSLSVQNDAYMTVISTSILVFINESPDYSDTANRSDPRLVQNGLI